MPLGKADLVREGNGRDGRELRAPVAAVCAGRRLCCARAHGLTFDVIDLRSIFPYDWHMISHSVLKTGRVLFVNEDTEVTNFGEHLLRRVVDQHFYDLLVRPRVLQGQHVPGIGLNQNVRTEHGAAVAAHSRGDARLGHRGGLAPMDYRVPELGEGVYEAEFVEWLVRPGQDVARGRESRGSDDRQGDAGTAGPVRRPHRCRDRGAGTDD